jgi:hypothetical protein
MAWKLLAQRSNRLPVFAQQRNQIGESPSGDGIGAELEFELGQSAAILALSSASRAFSFLICSVSLSTCKITFSSCCIRCLRAIDLISIAATGCQLSLDNQRRQRGKEDRYADLLIDPDGETSKEIDMVVTSEQRDQSEQNTADDGDPALQVESQQHSSQNNRPHWQ